MISDYENLYPDIGGFRPKLADVGMKLIHLADVWVQKFVCGHLRNRMVLGKDRRVSAELS